MEKWNAGPITYDEKSRRMADEMVQAEARHIARRSRLKISTAIARTECFLARRFADRRDVSLCCGISRRRQRRALAQTAKAPPGAIQFRRTR